MAPSASAPEGFGRQQAGGVDARAREGNGILRLHLGLPQWLVRHLVHSGTGARRLVELLSLAAGPVEALLLAALARAPARLLHAASLSLFRLWVGALRCLPARVAKRGLSDSLSLEAHALSALLWWSRILPLTLRRMRFGLTTLGFAYLPAPGRREDCVDLPELGVRGIYLHSAPSSVEDPPVLLWFFGGAFFAGACADNRGLAERYAARLGCDVFLADYRVCPEHTVEDAYRDGCRAYEWLLSKKAPEKIVLFGVSSGGGICLRVLQLAGAAEAERRRFFRSAEPLPQPAGAALLGPFVNYTAGHDVDPQNSLMRHQEMDLIVTQRVFEFIHPQLADACGGEDGKRALSPLFHDVGGLCPILVSYSAHEVCTDDNRQLVEKLRTAGTEVERSERPYLCHAFQTLAAFLPEAAEEEIRICSWISQRGPVWQAAA